METEGLVDVAWQLPDEAEGIIVAHWARPDGEMEAERYTVGPDQGLEEIPDEVSQILEEDGRDYGVWTRR